MPLYCIVLILRLLRCDVALFFTDNNGIYNFLNDFDTKSLFLKSVYNLCLVKEMSRGYEAMLGYYINNSR